MFDKVRVSSGTLAIMLFTASPGLIRAASVRAWEGKIDLPTYVLGEEDPAPPFPLDNQHRVYPYTMLDDLTDHVETRTYRAIYLENEFIKMIVLPDLGGRVFSVYDKRDRREVFLRNNVVKYALVALRGAWIPGGIEFNFPDGHNMVTVSPVSSTFRQNPGGSATVIVGDVDQITGMHWEVALTLQPGQARVEQHVTLFNCTPTTNLYWYWANAAVPATDDTQFIYPMREFYTDVRGVVWSYPVHAGVDYSWSRNIRQPISIFARQVHRNFFGVYFHKSDYGIVHVADFREVPGKKIWAWGAADDGLIWKEMINDQNEIQSGRYETQLDYEFMPPQRAESWTEYWYPVHGLGGGFVEATSQLAMNVHYLPPRGSEKAQVKFVICATVEIPDAKVSVKLGSRLLRQYELKPLHPLTATELTMPVGNLESAKQNLGVVVEAADGRTLLSWSAAGPIDGNIDFVPLADKSPREELSPEEMSVEQLFLSGVEQEREANEGSAQAIYELVLKRDPGYIPALLKLAWQQYRAADFLSADSFVARALERDERDPAVHYAAGVIYRAEQRWTLAQDAFWAAIHYGGRPSPAYVQLGEISIREKHYDQAAGLLRQALTYDPDNTLALTDLAVALRLSGTSNDVSAAVAQAAERMPLLPYALAERWRLIQTDQPQSGSGESIKTAGPKFGRSDLQNYLVVAAWYFCLDDLRSAYDVLKAACDDLPPASISPLVYYFLAAIQRRWGQAEQARSSLAKAIASPYEKVFPNRLADAQVLEEASKQNPLDSHAEYFLGNFLFAHGRYEDAAKLWARALGKGFEYSVLMRNLGLYSWKIKKDLAKASTFYEGAVRLAPDDYRLYVDLDKIYFQLGDTAAREKLFANASSAVCNRDTVLMRIALLHAEKKQFDQARQLFINHIFNFREEGAEVRELFVLVNIWQGRQALADNMFHEAETFFREALEYPRNLAMGKPDKPHDEEALYWLGEALAAQGRGNAAREAWQQAVEESDAGQGVSRLIRGLALRRLGQAEQAQRILKALTTATSQGNVSAEDFYVAGLFNLFDDRREQAQDDLRRAFELDPSLWRARVEMQVSGR